MSKSSLKRTLLKVGAIPFLLSSCTGGKYQSSVFAFDTVINLQCPKELDIEMNESTHFFSHMSDLLDGYKEIEGLTNLYTINKNNEIYVVEDDLANALLLAKQYWNTTSQYFNPFVRDLADLWKEAVKNDQLVEKDVYTKEVDKIIHADLFVEGNTVQRIGTAKIDLGGISKGLALQKARINLASKNVTDYIVDAGSSSIILGEKANGGTYKVGIKNTKGHYLQLSNCAIGTSSIYEQGYVEKKGTKYSHIVNARTGLAEVTNDIVIVVGNDPVACDVIATACVIAPDSFIADFESRFDVKIITYSNKKFTYVNPELKVY